jgi:site-specific recombinase XerD
MEEKLQARSSRGEWSTRKKDHKAPRGLHRYNSKQGKGWQVLYTCGAGHRHKEFTGALKSEAERVWHERRQRVRGEPGWCPRVEQRQAREKARALEEKERSRVLFRDYAKDYLEWARTHHHSYTTTRGQVEALIDVFGDRHLDEITTADVERFLARLSEGESPSKRPLSAGTLNRYRDRFSGMFKRAVRLGLVLTNRVTGVAKHKEPGGRIVYLPPAHPGREAFEEDAVRRALPPELRPLFIVSVHTGLRWSEQVKLRWRDVDLHSGVITVPRSKHGEARHVPINSVVRSVLFDLGLHRERPDDSSEHTFACRYKQADKFFPKAVGRAQEELKRAGKDASRLESYTWHGNRHTFASRLVMAGVDLRAVQELGGWKSLKMVERYGHLAPDHLRAAVERLAMPARAALHSDYTSSRSNGSDVM